MKTFNLILTLLALCSSCEPSYASRSRIFCKFSPPLHDLYQIAEVKKNKEDCIWINAEKSPRCGNAQNGIVVGSSRVGTGCFDTYEFVDTGLAQYIRTTRSWDYYYYEETNPSDKIMSLEKIACYSIK